MSNKFIQLKKSGEKKKKSVLSRIKKIKNELQKTKNQLKPIDFKESKRNVKKRNQM